MTITFVLMNAIPGSPLDSEKFLDVTLKQAMLAKYGLDRPLYERYLKYLADYLHGDFGISYIKVGLSTNEIIAAGFPYSLRIGIYSSVLIIIFGIAAGILAALRQNKFVDRFLMVLSTLGSTIPSFVFATLYLFLFSKILGLVPAFEWQTGRDTSALSWLPPPVFHGLCHPPDAYIHDRRVKPGLHQDSEGKGDLRV